jgi:transposase-like protein
MPKHYTPQQKTEALALVESTGSVTLASLQTGIPERTLYHWRRQQQLRDGVLQKKNSLPPQKNTPLTQEQVTAELRQLRDQIMSHIFAITATLSEDDGHVNHRAIALTRLLDRVMKLNTQVIHLEPGQQTIRIEYLYPDGSVHARPAWAVNDDNGPDQPWSPFWDDREEAGESAPAIRCNDDQAPASEN